MLKGLGDIASLMKGAREIQEKMKSFKESLTQVQIEGLGGGGLVRVQGRADGCVLSVVLDEGMVAKGDKAMIEDLTLAAVNSFQQKVGEIRKEKLTELTGGIGLPPGMDLPL